MIAVSKFHPTEVVREAYEAGQRLFGESRVQELMAKQPALPEDIQWHFIGTLQTNKVKYIAPFISMIESVDSLRLLHEIDRQAEKHERIIRLLIEVHIAKETGKHGFSPDECKAFFASDAPTTCKHVQICGLMGMATFTDNKQQVRREFQALKALFDEIKVMPSVDSSVFTEVSMGMSDDYRIAIEEGSTIVRVGTAIFGERE